MAHGVAPKPPLLLLQQTPVALVEDHEVLLGYELAEDATVLVICDLIPEQVQSQIVQEALQVETGTQAVALPQLRCARLDPIQRNEGHGFGGPILKRW